MADINNFRQLDFQESGEPADNDRVLIVEIDNDKVVGAKNYALAKLKGYISADALAYLEECRLINTSVSEKEERVSNIASQSAELLEATVGETIDTIEQTVISTESGGINEFSVIQKNGTKHILQVRNGKQGDQGVPGGPGPAVPLVQTTGQSTTEAMSQKAVTDSLDSLKSDLVAKASMLSYEEIMASTPPLDLDVGIPKASVLKTLSDNLNGFSVLKSNSNNALSLDDLNSYPKGEGILHFATFYSGSSTGTFPFVDGHLLTFIWRNTGSSDILSQIAVEDDSSVIKIRAYTRGTWSAWKSVSIS